MSAPLDCVVTTPSHIRWTESNGEVILVNEEKEDVIGLDQVGANAFLRFMQQESFGNVVDALLREYEVEHAVLEQDLIQLLHTLCERKFITVSPPLPEWGRGLQPHHK